MRSAIDKVLVVSPEKCTRCLICELVCSFAKHEEYNPKKSLIKVVSNKDMNVNIPTISPECDLCDGDEKCARSCPSGVLQFVGREEAAMLRKDATLGKFPAPLNRSSVPGG